MTYMDSFDTSLAVWLAHAPAATCPYCDGEGGTWNRPCEPCENSGELK